MGPAPAPPGGGSTCIAASRMPGSACRSWATVASMSSRPWLHLKPQGLGFWPIGVFPRAEAEEFIAWTAGWAAGKR